MVKPEFQNKGIGTALLKEVETFAPKATAYQLFTGSKSARNIHLYEKSGYKVIHRATTKQGIELLQMEKKGRLEVTPAYRPLA